MKRFTKLLLCILACPLLTMCASDSDNASHPVTEQRLNPMLADPTIFEHDGTYYLYGTTNNPNIKEEGFLVYTSTDLENWEGPAGKHDGFAFKKGDGYGTTGFWAPQVFERNGKFYMAYTADEHIAIAEGDNPLGPFTNTGNAVPSDGKQIDPYVFYENDKIYLYHVRLNDGNRISVAEMEDDFSAIKPETLTECIHATQPWENTANTAWTVTEGPTVFKNGDLYYMLYSANDYTNKDYAVGYATSSSPLGPWDKAGSSPFISRNIVKYPGTGHGDLFYSTSGEMYYVFHTHFSTTIVNPRKTAIVPLSIDGGNVSVKAGATLTWPLVNE
jgi:beta-xylosidase